MKYIFLAGALTLGSSGALAAPGLSFNLAARIAPSGKSGFGPQTITARVLLSGSNARIETGASSSRAVVLYTPPFVYRLLPGAKAGVKYDVSKVRTSRFGNFDPQQLLRNPSQIRAALLQGGAKRLGIATLNGTPVEVFEATQPGQNAKIKAWIRRSDSLPVRLESSGGGLKVVATWSGYTRLRNVAASQFLPPKGFAIRRSQNPPPLPLL